MRATAGGRIGLVVLVAEQVVVEEEGGWVLVAMERGGGACRQLATVPRSLVRELMSAVSAASLASCTVPSRSVHSAGLPAMSELM